MVYLHKIAELPEEESKFVPQAVLGRTYTALGEYDRAADAYRRACMVKSPDPSLILNLAELEIIRKRYSSAEDLLARVCSRDATVLLMTTVLRLFLAAARGRFEEIHSVLRTIMRVLVAQGVPPDFRWDFSDVLPVLREVAHPDIFHLLRQMVGVLRRDVDVQEFVGSFPQVAEDWQPLLVRV